MRNQRGREAAGGARQVPMFQQRTKTSSEQPALSLVGVRGSGSQAAAVVGTMETQRRF